MNLSQWSIPFPPPFFFPRKTNQSPTLGSHNIHNRSQRDRQVRGHDRPQQRRRRPGLHLLGQASPPDAAAGPPDLPHPRPVLHHALRLKFTDAALDTAHAEAGPQDDQFQRGQDGKDAEGDCGGEGRELEYGAEDVGWAKRGMEVGCVLYNWGR